MTDDVIERCTAAGVRCLHKDLPGETTIGDARPLITEAILSALKPGDVLPNGCVVVPRKITPAMRDAMDNELRAATDGPGNDYVTNPDEVYAAMLAAAKEEE